MPGLLECQTGRRVIFLPKDAVSNQSDFKDENEEGDKEKKIVIVKLPHPGKGSPALFLLNHQNKKLFEIMSYQEPNRSWFIGDLVVDDGSLMITTPVNPVFIILPFLIKTERNVPLEDLLENDEYSHLHEIASIDYDLSCVATQIGDTSLNVWKYDENKCLKWLQERVEAVKKVLMEQKVDLSAGATSLIYQANVDATSVEYTRFALGIVCEYLSEDLVEKLTACLNLPEPERPAAPAKRQSEGAPGKVPPAKKIKHEGPTEDYSKDAKKEKGKEVELNAKQKALAKSAEGTKNIMSFFKKK